MPPISKPTPGQMDWDLPLNNALDELDSRLAVAEVYAEDAASTVGAHEGRIQQLEANNVQAQIGDATSAALRAETAVLQTTAISNGVSSLGINAGVYGVLGDGVADDSAALQQAANAAAALGATLNLPVDSTVRLATASLVATSGLRINGSGSTIKNAMPGASDRIISIVGQTDVVIENIILDGDKASFAPATQQRHGVFIADSTRVTLRSVNSSNNKGDGVYVGDSNNGPSFDIVLDRVTCDQNHRQGLSVSAVSGLVALASTFTNTSGTNPQSGVDLEPNIDTDILEKVSFIGCEFNGNAGSGVIATFRHAPSVRQGDIRFIACKANGNTNQGLYIQNATEFRWLDGTIRSNGQYGAHVLSSTGGTSRDITISGEVSHNQQHGVRVDSVFQRLTLINANIHDNGLAGGSYFGASINPAAGSSTDLQIVSCSFYNQYRPIQTSSFVGRVTLAANRYYSHSNSDTPTLGDTVATRQLYDGTPSPTMGGTRTVATVATNSAISIDAAGSSVHVVTLNANVTGTTITNAVSGRQLTIVFIQDATGGRTYVWPTNCRFAGAVAPNDTTASRRTSVTFWTDGTNWYEQSRAVAVG